jgi:hypothetical protein
MPEYKQCDYQPIKQQNGTKLFATGTSGVRFRYTGTKGVFYRKKLFATPL